MAINNYTDADFAALLARVNAIDGDGLTDPTQAALTVATAGITGVRTTLLTTVLAIQSKIQDLQTQLASLQTALNTHLGVH